MEFMYSTVFSVLYTYSICRVQHGTVRYRKADWQILVSAGLRTVDKCGRNDFDYACHVHLKY